MGRSPIVDSASFGWHGAVGNYPNVVTRKTTMTSVFLAYARDDNVEPFDPATSFAARLHRDLTARGFEVWFDRMAMPSRGLTFHQEIQDAVAARERLLLVVGPKAAVSDYMRQGCQFVHYTVKAVTPILRQGDYPLVPDGLKLLLCEDFRDAPNMPFIWRSSSGSCANHADVRPQCGSARSKASCDAHCQERLEILQESPTTQEHMHGD